VTGVEQHAEYIRDVIGWLRDADAAAVEAEPHAEDEWVQAVNERSQMTLFPRCNSWYLGANVPGKPRVFMPYIGFPDYSAKLESVRAANFAGFALQR